MFGLRIGKVVSLMIFFLIGCGPSTSSAQGPQQQKGKPMALPNMVLPARGYHLADIEPGPGGKPPKPAAMFRHLIFNFQNPGFHSADTFLDTAVGQLMALQVAGGKIKSQSEDPQTFAATQDGLKEKLGEYYNTKGDDGKAVAQKLSGLYQKLFLGFNSAFAPQFGLPAPKFDGSPEKLVVDVMTDAQRLFRMMLLVSRTFPNDLFAELRKHEPVFMVPGDDENSPVIAAQKAAGLKLARPVEKATYLVTRYQDIAYGYAYNTQDPAASGYGDNWAPVAVKRQVPPYTDVIYSRAVYYFGSVMQMLGKVVKLMDYATGAYLTDTLEWDIEGAFMLGTKDTKVNEEKAYLHKLANRIQKMHGEAGELADREESMNKVREVVAWYVKDAMKNKAGKNSLDFARDISRHAALGMVSDYFGFYPPDVNSQIQWSRNTQNSFFHNIFDDPWFDHLNMKAGEEMASYISQVFTPAYKAQLENGRPAVDTVSMMIEGHAKIPALIKGAFDINDKRIMANTMGLLVGAGETTTMAANFALHTIMVEAAKRAKAGDFTFWVDFLTTAKMAAAGDKAAKVKFDAYIWEGLRFTPVNPWTEREADMDSGVITTNLEDASQPAGNGAEFTYEVKKGARVLFVTQSAMFDPAMKLVSGDQVPGDEKDPWVFSLNRGNDNYIHLAFGYHRCLGDDVAQAMIPEIVLQVIANVDDIDLSATLASVDNPKNTANPVDRELMFSPQTVPVDPAFIAATEFPKTVLDNMRTPFPETFTIVYGSKVDAVKQTRKKSEMAYARDLLQKMATEDEWGASEWGSQVKEVIAYLEKTEATNAGGASDRVLDNGLNRFDVEAFKKNQENLNELETKMIAHDKMDNKDACMAMQTDDYGDGANSQTRQDICAYRTKLKSFNVCYFLQRTGGQLSSQHAFNKCAYEKNLFPAGFLTKYLDSVEGKGELYWVKYHRAAQ